MDSNPTEGSGQAGSGQDGKFFSGFLLGLLVGAGVVFLLGTKKGKRLLKAISEKGLDNISNILEEADKTADLDEVVEKKSRKEFVQEKEFDIREKPIEEKPRVRRFFRGISRHLN